MQDYTSVPHQPRGNVSGVRAETWHEIIRGDRCGIVATLARCGLRMASWPYGIGVRTRNAFYDRGWKRISRSPVPVVSIGNLSLGGTGKTPCVEYVGRFFGDRDVRAAILSRGYGSDTGRNDEAMVLEENLPEVPHLQGADRVEIANVAIEELEAELLILDDGFQHRRLFRNLDVVLIDATRPPDRDYLFPRGTLREPVSSLNRADAIVLTRCDQVTAEQLNSLHDWLKRQLPAKPVAATEHRPVELTGGETVVSIEGLTNQPVAAFCGIGNPRAFRRTLENLGAALSDFRAFPDHHAYTRTDVDDLIRWANGLPPNALIATTQKDWVKLRISELAGRPLRAVRIGLAFRSGQLEFDEKLRSCLPNGRDGGMGD
jgi:tetraacyldisaccharide 4'-kinase